MKKVLVVAHPDDEVLFFSSIIEKVDAVIVCFGPSSNQKVTDGRRLLQNRYPLQHIEWLNIQESDVYLSANWNRPRLTDEGIFVRRNQDEYHNNFTTLVKLFKTKLALYDVIYTHNPWGEYGHEEHILVFKAVCSATESMKSVVYVPSYISDRSKKTFDIQKVLLGSELAVGKVPKNLCISIKKLYIDTKCWTWHDEYIWPESEVFIKLRNHDSTEGKKFWKCNANPPVMLLTQSFKISYLQLFISRLLPTTLKKKIKRLLKKPN